MTLEPYTAEKLDELSLRLLDVAVMLRGMANSSREQELGSFQLHDKKALEWLAKLDGWARDSAARLDTLLIKQRSRDRAHRPIPRG